MRSILLCVLCLLTLNACALKTKRSTLRSSNELFRAMKHCEYLKVKNLLTSRRHSVDEFERGVPLLFAAIQECDLGMLNLLISLNVNLNNLDEDYNNALHTALLAGKSELVPRLLEAGVKTDIFNENGLNPLHLASLYCKPNAASAIAKEMHSLDDLSLVERVTSLHLAAWKGCDEVVRILVEQGADINEHSHGVSPLTTASTESIRKYLTDNRAEEFENLLRFTTRDVELWTRFDFLNIITLMGKSLLQIAVTSSSPRVVMMMLENDADPNYTDSMDSEYLSPLHEACIRGDLSIVQALIQFGAQVDSLSSIGSTPLFLVAEIGRLDIAEHLCENGADVNADCGSGVTPLIMAQSTDNHEMIQLLEKYSVYE